MIEPPTAYRIALVFSPHMDHELQIFAHVRHWHSWPATVRFRQFIPHPRQDPWPDVDSWQPHGVIGHMTDPVTIHHLERIAHLVRLAPARDGSQPADVGLDYAAIAQTCVNHLIRLGYTSLGTLAWTPPIITAIATAAHSAGLPLYDLTPEIDIPPPRGMTPAGTMFEHLKATISQVPKPLGIVCEYDEDAVKVADACLEDDLSIPQDIGILGTGTSSQIGILNQPTLSNLQLPTAEIGRAAAARMSDLLEGKAPAPHQHFAPIGRDITKSCG